MVREFNPPGEGFVTRCDARGIGEIVRDLGGGRATKETEVRPEAGIDQLIKPGEAFGRNSTLARVHAMTEADAERALQRLPDAIEFAGEPLATQSLIVEVIG